MAAVGTLSEAIDNLYTTTWYNMKSKAADQIFDGSPFWFWLRANGGMEKTEGGRHINEPLRYYAVPVARDLPLHQIEDLIVQRESDQD